jgi:gluconokinase
LEWILAQQQVREFLYQENGKKIEESTIPYPLIQEKVDQAEEDPQVIFDAVQKIILT